jgi:hypothetical protein
MCVGEIKLRGCLDTRIRSVSLELVETQKGMERKDSLVKSKTSGYIVSGA